MHTAGNGRMFLADSEAAMRDRFRAFLERNSASKGRRRWAARYWNLRAMVYALLEKPKTAISVFYHILIFGYIVFVHTFTAWNSEISAQTIEFVIKLEHFLAAYFLVEFVLRVWSAGADVRFQGWEGRKRFLFRPMCLIDTSILVVTFSLVWLMERKNAAHFMDVLRFVQILRLLHIDRQMVSFSLIKEMIAESKFELVTIYYITVFLLALLACVVYTIEEDAMAVGLPPPSENATFANYGESFWFSAVSIFTIGYGDIVPQTWQGKAVVCVLAYLGLLMFGAASTLVGVQMSLQLDNRNKKEKKDKARILAACLIQSWWRYHLITNEKTFKTIKVYRDFCVVLNVATERLLRARQSARRELNRSRRNGRNSRWTKKMRFMVKPISTANGSLSFQFDLRNTLKTHAATAIYVSASDLNVADDIESTRSLPRSETQSELQKMARTIAERGRRGSASIQSEEPTRSTSIRTPLALLRRKVESGIMGRLLRDASVETNDSQLPDRDEGEDLYDNPSVTSTITLMSDRRSIAGVEAPVLTGRHRAILRLLYFMLFMSLKKKFSRARKPYELNDAEQELLELEHKRMRALRQLEKKFERTIGAKAAEEAENEAPQTILTRLDDCEKKMAGVEEKVLGLEQMILQIAQLMEDREVQLVEDSPPRFLHPLSQ